jgi:hypothetical protein
MTNRAKSAHDVLRYEIIHFWYVNNVISR